MLVGQATAARVTAVFGEYGAAWLQQLPGLVAEIVEQWQLTEVSPPYGGARASFVAPVLGPQREPLVLKIAPEPFWIRHEAAALEHWDGHGAVRLVRVDMRRGALLTERAVPGISLVATAGSDDHLATMIAADVIAVLQSARRSARPDALPTVAAWLEKLDASAAPPRPRLLTRSCEEARSMARALLSSPNEWVVLHGDLHHGNLLRARDERWLAADPKGLIGPREVEAAALLRNPRRLVLGHRDPASLMRGRVAALSQRLDFSPRRLAQWGFVMAVVAAVWSLEDGEDADDVARWLQCAGALRCAFT